MSSDEHKFGVRVAICDTCGSVDEFSYAMLKARLEGVVAANVFRPTGTKIEIHGITALSAAIYPCRPQRT